MRRSRRLILKHLNKRWIPDASLWPLRTCAERSDCNNKLCRCRHRGNVLAAIQRFSPLPLIRVYPYYPFNPRSLLPLRCHRFIHSRILHMTKTFTCTQARARLASLCKDVTDDSDYVIITRPGHEDVALISASELSSLIETAHLLSSPKNAERLATALNRAKSGTEPSQSIDDLRREVGL